MVYLVREFPTPAHVVAAVKAGAKLHVWEEGLGDLQGDAEGLIVHGPGPKDPKWKIVVEIRGGIVVKAYLTE